MKRDQEWLEKDKRLSVIMESVTAFAAKEVRADQRELRERLASAFQELEEARVLLERHGP